MNRMQQPISSRLARRQGEKMARQSVAMIVFSISVLVIFVFFLMPRLINLAFSFLGSGDISFKNEDKIPPQIPVVLPLPEATKESVLKLEGYGEAKTSIFIINNGTEVTSVTVDDEGKFSYELTLSEGENKIRLYGKDEAGNESTVKEVAVALDTEKPGLELENLTEDTQVITKQNQNYSIKGKTEPHSKLTINDRSVYVDGEGLFTTSYYLQEGDNTLKFKIEDKAGNATEKEFRVNFKY